MAALTDSFVQWVPDSAQNLQSEFWQLAVRTGFFEFIPTKKTKRMSSSAFGGSRHS